MFYPPMNQGRGESVLINIEDYAKYEEFDEIQYTENWELWMKVIYDSRKDIRINGIEDGQPRNRPLGIKKLSFYETASFCSWMICPCCRTLKSYRYSPKWKMPREFDGAI